MKNAVLATLALLVSATAHAGRPSPELTGSYTTSLYAFNIQPQSTLSHLTVTDGFVTVDHDAKTLTLNLGRAIVKSVPLLKTETGACNETIYSGHSDDDIRADGILTSLQVVDNSQNYCDILVPPTAVELRIEGGFAGFNETHTMEGKPLQARFASAELSTFNIKPNTFLADKNIQAGSIVIDRVQKELTLTLFTRSNCPEGAFCFVMPMMTLITLPLDSVFVNRCNEVIYRSQLAPALGGVGHALAQLFVTDRSASLCLVDRSFPTGVRLVIHGFINETHTMEGAALN